jgi:hypothetical protein
LQTAIKGIALWPKVVALYSRMALFLAELQTHFKDVFYILLRHWLECGKNATHAGSFCTYFNSKMGF